jgi:hypothetical protein
MTCGMDNRRKEPLPSDNRFEEGVAVLPGRFWDLAGTISGNRGEVPLTRSLSYFRFLAGGGRVAEGDGLLNGNRPLDQPRFSS